MIYYILQKQKIITLILACFSISFSVYANKTTLPKALTQAIKDGKTKKANELAAEIVFTAEDTASGARANIVMSILLFLDAEPEASSRAQSIGDFYLDTKDSEEKRALLILKYLGGKSSEKKLLENMQKQPADWKATAVIARYVKILSEEGVNAKKLNACVKEYMELSEKMGKESWGNVWRNRLIRWHNSLQDKMDKGDGLEKLIGQVKDDVLAGPLKGQLISIGNVIELYLKDKKNDASKACRKSLGEIEDKDSDANRGYVAILEYLGGNKKNMQDVYKLTRGNSDLFIIAGISIFTKDLSNSKDGEINKNSLLIHLKNFSNNINNSERQTLLDWKNRVEKWKKWCNEEFPLKAGQEPLLVRHSKVYAEKNKEKLARKSALAIYEKLRSARTIDSVSLNDFTKLRVLFKNRPKPENMDFSIPEIKTYLQSLPFETQQGEWGRVRYMKAFTENMATNLNFTQYTGTIKLNSSTIKGQVVSANTDSVTIKVRSRSKKYKWSDIKPEQFIAFTDDFTKYYIGGKSKVKENIFNTKTDRDKALCKNYRQLAIFCDWYGMYQDALQSAKKAEKYKNYDKGSTRRLLLD